MVEFALAISVFMLLVLGTFDLVRAYLAYTVVTNVVREAGRYGAAHFTESDPSYLADSKVAGKNLAVGIDASALTLTVVAASGVPTYITVVGTYPFHSLTPMVGALMGDPINISASTSTLVG